jgi:hypothetical protein
MTERLVLRQNLLDGKIHSDEEALYLADLDDAQALAAVAVELRDPAQSGRKMQTPVPAQRVKPRGPVGPLLDLNQNGLVANRDWPAWLRKQSPAGQISGLHFVPRIACFLYGSFRHPHATRPW